MTFPFGNGNKNDDQQTGTDPNQTGEETPKSKIKFNFGLGQNDSPQADNTQPTANQGPVVDVTPEPAQNLASEINTNPAPVEAPVFPETPAAVEVSPEKLPVQETTPAAPAPEPTITEEQPFNPFADQPPTQPATPQVAETVTPQPQTSSSPQEAPAPFNPFENQASDPVENTFTNQPTPPPNDQLFNPFADQVPTQPDTPATIAEESTNPFNPFTDTTEPTNNMFADMQTPAPVASQENNTPPQPAPAETLTSSQSASSADPAQTLVVLKSQIEGYVAEHNQNIRQLELQINECRTKIKEEQKLIADKKDQLQSILEELKNILGGFEKGHNTINNSEGSSKKKKKKKPETTDKAEKTENSEGK